MHESAEQGVAREVLEETGMSVTETKYLFSLPNTYLYSGFVVHTIDAFFLCSVPKGAMPVPHDDVAECRWVPMGEVNADDFGLDSVREGVRRIIDNSAAQREQSRTRLNYAEPARNLDA